jgi:hypothetical protein
MAVHLEGHWGQVVRKAEDVAFVKWTHPRFINLKK